MFKFTVLCLMAVLASTCAAPGYLSQLTAYSSPHHTAAYAAAPIGYGAQYVAPYSTSYNAHQIDHSVAYPIHQYASAAYAAPATYVATPAAYGATPLGYPFQAAYASHPVYAQQAYAQQAYAQQAYAGSLYK